MFNPLPRTGRRRAFSVGQRFTALLRAHEASARGWPFVDDDRPKRGFGRRGGAAYAREGSAASMPGPSCGDCRSAPLSVSRWQYSLGRR
jgi:hypothetical protein